MSDQDGNASIGGRHGLCFVRSEPPAGWFSAKLPLWAFAKDSLPSHSTQDAFVSPHLLVEEPNLLQAEHVSVPQLLNDVHTIGKDW